MELVIDVEQSDPPAGTVRLTSAPGGSERQMPTPFAGWLGLIRALNELLTHPESPMA
jgi:hypothetical protein